MRIEVTMRGGSVVTINSEIEMLITYGTDEINVRPNPGGNSIEFPFGDYTSIKIFSDAGADAAATMPARGNR